MHLAAKLGRKCKKSALRRRHRELWWSLKGDAVGANQEILLGDDGAAADDDDRGDGGGGGDVDQGDFPPARQQTLMVFKSGGSARPTAKIGCRMMHYGTLCPDVHNIDVLYEIRRKATCQLAAINTKFAWKLNFVAKNSDGDCDDSGTDRTTGQSRFCFWLSNHQSKCAICGNVKKMWVEVWIML